MSEPLKKQKKQNKLILHKKKSSQLTRKEELAENLLDNLKNDKNIHRSEVLDTLLEKGYMNEEQLAQVFAKKYDIEFVQNLNDYKITKEVLELVPKNICDRHILIPITKIDKFLIVAFSDPSDMNIKDSLSFITGHKIKSVVSTRESIKNTLNKYYNNHKQFDDLLYRIDSGLGEVEDDLTVDLNSQKGEGGGGDSVISFVNLIFADAIQLQSSDIHIEVYEKAFRIRYRVDGILHEQHSLPKEMAASIISRIKVMAQMDISEKRRPQDARLKVRLGERELNMRASSIPTVSGEKIVLRVLDDSALRVDLSQLGMDQDQSEMFKDALAQSQGLILMTGPTGSGKTTTIYSGLMKLNTHEKNISTAEDPVEFRIHGINQVQVNPKVGVNFSSTLRSFLRQDPDVILVGEVRDIETADMAFKASSTGHLVLSTLHTNDTASTVTRLLSMGVPSYVIADNVSIIISQRLLRCLCQQCYQLDGNENLNAVLMEIGVPEEELDLYKDVVYKKGIGCSNCNNIGYKGRVAVYEMMQITPNIKKGIFSKISSQELKNLASKDDKMRTIRKSALLKLREGIVDLDEVVKKTLQDEGI